MTRVLVTGVFDVLHQEHIEFLKNAAKQGDYLIIGIESDVRVKALKGPTRPINNQEKRKAALEALEIADSVLILPEQFSNPEDHKKFLDLVNPDILAVSESTPNIKQKTQLMKERGGKLVVVHSHNPNISSTKLIEIQNSQNQKKMKH